MIDIEELELLIPIDVDDEEVPTLRSPSYQDQVAPTVVPKTNANDYTCEHCHNTRCNNKTETKCWSCGDPINTWASQNQDLAVVVK